MADNFTVLQNSTGTVINVRFALATLVPQWCRTVLMIFMCIVFVVGIPGNALIILVQMKMKKKTSTDWLITFLAVSDIVSVSVSVPIYTLIMTGLWPNIGSTFGCRLHHLVIHSTFIASTIIIASIAIDRLWKSKSVHQLITPKRALYIGISTLGVSLVTGTIAGFTRRNNILGQCTRDNSKMYIQFILYAVMAIAVLVSICTILISYIRVAVHLTARNKGINSSDAQNNREIVISAVQIGRYGKALRITKLMILVSIVFILLTMSPAVSVLVLASTELKDTMHVKIVIFFLTRLYLINSCVNPLFLFGLNTTFRNKVTHLVKNRCLCY